MKINKIKLFDHVFIDFEHFRLIFFVNGIISDNISLFWIFFLKLLRKKCMFYKKFSVLNRFLQFFFFIFVFFKKKSDH